MKNLETQYAEFQKMVEIFFGKDAQVVATESIPGTQDVTVVVHIGFETRRIHS